MSDDERVSRLPQWAQTRIRSQAARIEGQQAELELLRQRAEDMLITETAGPEPVDTYLARDVPPGAEDAPDFPLGHGVTVRFGNWAEIHWASGALVIDTDSAMMIIPENDGTISLVKAD